MDERMRFLARLREGEKMAGVVPPRMSFVHDDCHQWPLTHFQDGDPITGWIGRLA
jgi:hypothetical protein